MNIIVDHLDISYELKGRGRLLLLLHGWGDDHHTYAGLMSVLENNYQLVALDLPGFGGSEPPKQPWNLDDYAELTAHFMEKLGLDPIYAIFGHSNGGALAIRALATGVLKANRLVLLASAGVRNSQPAKRLATRSVAKVGKATTFWLPEARRQQLRQKLYGSIGSDMLTVPALEETFKRTVKQDVQADAAQLKLTTLIINANHDPAIPLKDGERFHELIKNSRLEVLPSNSHFIHQTNAKEVVSLIEDFLS
ncbi:alpha/beta hydrolase [Patescibacteria group bacterium]|nr:alpha/beta hydrolase [Patescibacteria group bacterium]